MEKLVSARNPLINSAIQVVQNVEFKQVAHYIGHALKNMFKIIYLL